MNDVAKLEAPAVATLQEFVLQAFKDISSAVQAFELGAPTGMTARPLLIGPAAGNVHRGNDGAVVVIVDFDVATTNELKKGLNGEIGLSVSAFKAGGGKDRSESSRTENRLRFSLPLQLGRGAEAREKNERDGADRRARLSMLDAAGIMDPGPNY